MTTTIQVWRGLHTIGGNIAEIRYGKDRVIFDFGLVFDPAGSLLDGNVKRENKYVHDLLRLGMLPPIEGVYAKEDLQATTQNRSIPLATDESDLNTGIFISHLHLDHMGAIRAISPHIPIYMSEESIELYQVLMKIEEEEKNQRDFLALNGDTTIHIGAITVTPFYVDHDIRGALSLLIETPDLTIVYSGDFRMHGDDPERIENWIEQISKKEIDILFIEGTTFRPKETKREVPLLSEKEICTKISEAIQQVKGLAIFNIYHRNIDRIQKMLATGKEVGRQVVLEVETAYIADKFLDKESFLIIDSTDIDMPEWKRRLFQKYTRINVDEINQAPENYFLQNSFHHLMDLLDYNVLNSMYIHSNGVPLGDFDPNYYKLLAFLERLCVEYQTFDVSGHATQEDILDVIERIKPSILIPWHSHYPELVKPRDEKQVVFLPENEVIYKYQNNRLVNISCQS